jgi:hypothetical protein
MPPPEGLADEGVDERFITISQRYPTVRIRDSVKEKSAFCRAFLRPSHAASKIGVRV